jgi:hypothetical protein
MNLLSSALSPADVVLWARDLRHRGVHRKSDNQKLPKQPFQWIARKTFIHLQLMELEMDL